MRSKVKFFFLFLISNFAIHSVYGQYVPKNISNFEKINAKKWVDSTYNSLSQDQKLGQLFIVALYTNKGESYINNVRNLVETEHLGGLILMQDNAEREINLVNEFQKKSNVPLMIGMDAEWGLYQRIPTAHKLPWAITLGAIQDKNLVYQLSSKIADDAKLMGINWNFAPVVDVNTNPNNPIIGNRSFGSDVNNVTASGLAYTNGLQDHQTLAAIKHFPGHGDTDTDSHLDLPMISHNKERLEKIELAPFKNLMNKGVGGVMVAHLYVPALEPRKGIPASLSYNIVTKLLKEKFGYKGLIITDALNMGAVAKRYTPGEVDALAFKAGNDIMLFSDGVKEGKRRIQSAIDKGEISQNRVEESVKKILLTKYYLGLHEYQPINPEGINENLNTPSHDKLAQKMYTHALTLLKDEKSLLPLSCKDTYYYVPLEEAPHKTFVDEANLRTTLIETSKEKINSIPRNSTVIIGLHKDNSTAYKPYTISSSSRNIIQQLSKTNKVIVVLFGSPYGLKDLNIDLPSTVLVAYENNDDSMKAVAKSLCGESNITGKLPVVVNNDIPFGMGMDLIVETK